MLNRWYLSISRYLLKIAPAALALAMAAPSALARDIWNGVAISESLLGSGTAADPYQIWTGADLKLLSELVKASSAQARVGAVYVKQMDDIDLYLCEWSPIGNGQYPFLGHYDGNGFSIHNLKLLINKARKGDNFTSIGLFGDLGKQASVTNLCLYHPVITASANFTNADNDYRLGFVAGTMESGSSITYVVVNNGEITDGGHDLKLRSLMAGGIAGSAICDYATYNNNNISGNSLYKGPITVKHVAVNMDVDLRYSTIQPRLTGTTSSHYTQFNVGGITGRIRRGTIDDVPDNCVFTGKIFAPTATIGPVYGIMRGNGDETRTGKYMARAYAGEFATSKDIGNDKYNVNVRDTTLNDSGRFFALYSIFDQASQQYVNITGTNPPSTTDRIFGTRTLAPNANADGSETNLLFRYNSDVPTTDGEGNITELGMKSYQGVNVGQYVNTNDDYAILAMLDRLNADDPDRFGWSYSSNQVTFGSTESAVVERRTARNFLAIIDYYNPTKTYTYRWTLTDAFGQTATASISSAAAPVQQGNLHLSTTGKRCTLTSLTALSDCTSLLVEVIGSDDEVISSTETPVNPLSFSVTREIVVNAEGYNNHREFTAVLNCADQFPLYEEVDNPYISYVWQIPDGHGGWRDLLDSEFNEPTVDPSPGVVGIASTFVGNLRLWVYSCEPGVDPAGSPGVALSRSLAADGTPQDFIEQTIKGLQLSVRLEQVNSGATEDFDPNSYYITTGGVSNLYDYDTHGITGALTDTKVPMLLFTARVVDQFGVDWTDSSDPARLSRWRLEWNYRVPGMDDYAPLNGAFDPHASGDMYGLVSEIDASLPVDDAGHVGAYSLSDHGRILLAHPNLLARTTSFWVRIRLYDVQSDPEGLYPTESFLEFTQIRVAMEREGAGYAGYPTRRTDGQALPFGSDATFQWFATADITADNGWTAVSEPFSIPDSQTDRRAVLATVDPNLYYKLVYTSNSGMTASDIIGPENVVFVYDRAISAEHSDLHDFEPYDATAHAYYLDGHDINDGRTPRTAVKTMRRAFEILSADSTFEHNRIVVMGYYHDADFINYYNSPYSNSNNPYRYNKAATITGRFGANIKGGTIGFGTMGTPTSAFELSLQAPMRWENIDIHSLNSGTGYNCLYLWNHDFTVGEGVRMVRFAKFDNEGGLKTDAKAVNFTLVVARMNNNKEISPAAGKDHIDYTGNANPNYTTVKLYSGSYGRIISAGRNNKRNEGSHNIFGHPADPNRARITIDIKHPTGNINEYSPAWANGASNYAANCDIGMMVGGQTDGSVYTDTEVNLYNGHISRYIAGNISYGRRVAGYPDDGFFGSTVLNIYGGKLDELYGSSLGRHKSNDEASADQPLRAYFYGQSIFNLYGGTVSDDFTRNGRIFASGAGSASGLGANWDINGIHGEKAYTPDDGIPYMAAGSGSLSYGAFEQATAEGCEMPRMNIINTATGDTYQIELAKTKTEINLYGGVVYGDVYGGGYGYSDEDYLTYDKAPYRMISVDGADIKQSLAGVLFGTSYVRMLPNPIGGAAPLVTGNVYGGGSGSDLYLQQATAAGHAAEYDFTRVAQVFGDTYVDIQAGVVEGNVFASGMGMEQYSAMAALYGNAHFSLTDGEVKGNIYGGGMFSDLRSYKIGGNTLGGNTEVKIGGGVIGNCVFGGGRGSEESSANVDGHASVEITGGRFSYEPRDANDEIKSFNIYGGGYYNGYVNTTSVRITQAPLMSVASIGLEEGQEWKDAWDDLMCRRFCVYGGGWGENTLVRSTASVNINIDHVPTPLRLVAPDARPEITDLIPGQTIFDVAGGGYSGNVGYWVNEDGTPISQLAHPVAADYKRFVGGNVSVTIAGSPFVRKVVGGAFYATVNNTTTSVLSGSIGNIYGGALLGYVHNNARLYIGSNVDRSFPAYNLTTPELAKARNQSLFIRENVYGGNDVKGIVGTTFFERDFDDPSANLPDVNDDADNGPLFRADISDAENKGVTMYIFGGTFMGDVYGAGNGYYRGYYVPGWCRYNDGPARHYNFVKANGDPTNTGRVYRSRPMVGSVKLHIGGNSTDDRVTIMGDVYGGGRSCTVGQFNTVLAPEDPRRLVSGGFVHMNYGSYVTVNGSVYMGSQGRDFTTQHTVPSGIDLSTFVGSTTADLDRLGRVAYDHWYLDPNTNTYVPGFPSPGERDGNYGMFGMQMLRGYMKNLELYSDLELTFYDNPLVTENGETVYVTDDNGDTYPKRRTWLPAELANSVYNAKDVVFNSFFAGGKSGSMTNNVLMQYCYDTNQPIVPGTEVDPTHRHEKFGSIYRVFLPPGLTILDKVVGGTEDGVFDVYRYKDGSNYTELDNVNDDGTPREPIYTFEGGIISQNSYTFDLIVYHDIHGTVSSNIPPSVYSDLSTTHLTGEKGESYTLKDGTTIYRFRFDADNPYIPNVKYTQHHRYDMALVKDSSSPSGWRTYLGSRDFRPGVTTMKMTISCQFQPQPGDLALDPDYAAQIEENEGAVQDYFTHYGGVIYGGCFNSGHTFGDIILTVTSNTVGSEISMSDYHSFGEISSLRHNLGRVFGGGYGPATLVRGNTYVNLIFGFKGMNVFGGGCRGNVEGSTHINYIGNESESSVFGAIYGGALYGSVGVPRTYDGLGNIRERGTDIASNVVLISGNAREVYGGGCLGDLYGRAIVELDDQVVQEFDHFDVDRITGQPGLPDLGASRLVVGTVYGGNDVSGTIHLQPLPEPEATATDQEKADYLASTYSTSVHVYETPHTAMMAPAHEEAKSSPGSYEGYNGFPLIGSIYGGSNGDYGTHQNTQYYTSGKIYLGTGVGNNVMPLYLNGLEGSYGAFEVPHVDRASLFVEGGTIINLFGGGNASTVNEDTDLNIAYNETNVKARAGFANDDDLERLWNTMRLTVDEQLSEVITRADDSNECVFDYNVYRLFGGNDNADMAIQPTWHLNRGHVGSVYSGGNFGQMTYTKFDDDNNPLHGIRLSVNSRDFYANNIYGGGRVGDIHPGLPLGLDGTDPEVPDTFYGAVLDIYDGVIDHVYGGNDISGNVHYGTNVNIHGAISGDVYCAGNGNYRYLYDPSIEGDHVIEDFNEEYGGRYFILPRREVYGGDNPSNTERLLAINSYRPNVERALMNIEGVDEERIAYVRGSVYCGGNSATINGSHRLDLDNSDIRFNVGNNVRLNSVYLGSNGESLTDINMMRIIEQLNGIDLSMPNDLASTAGYETDPYGTLDIDKADKSLYPSLLDVYLSAVDVQAQPQDFDFNPDLENAYIGDFFVGGNNGSMLTNRTISLSFPRNLVVYGKIVGGSNNANLTYKGVTHEGGLIRPLSTATDALGNRLYTEKLRMHVLSRFEPWRVEYPVEGDIRSITLVADVDDSGDKPYFPESKCCIYGGCFSSGSTIGNVKIDIFSDLCAEPAEGSLIATELAKHGIGSAYTKQQAIVEGIDDLHRRAFAVIGSGYGENTLLKGNVTVRMLPAKLHPTSYDNDVLRPNVNTHPSVAAIFAGSQLGSVIGNTHIRVRDGMVLTNIYGGSESAPLYGSTEIIVGWPQYYTCKRTGRYMLDRSDNISKAATDEENWITYAAGVPRPAILREIYLREGETITPSLYRQLSASQPYVSGYSPESCFEFVDQDIPRNFATQHANENPNYKHITWDDVKITIGNPYSRTNNNANYLGHGNIYGGGFMSSASATTLAGQNTVRKFTAENAPSPELIGYGGNSTILVWDNYENANPDYAIGSRPAEGLPIIQDHISIGTGHYVEVPMKVGQDVMGKYLLVDDHYEHQSSHVLTPGDPMLSQTFYEIESDGGIYGGGRKVYVEGFRSCDIAYYGYAESSPQYPKLLNTFQRLDLLSITDCCMQLQGAYDFATDNTDATKYSLTRIGELQMNSSLPIDQALNPGERQQSGLYNILHTTPRTRNYLAIFHDVLYLGSMTSSMPLDAPYHGANGALNAHGDWNGTAITPSGQDVPAGADYAQLPDEFNYRQYKENRINNFYANRDRPNQDSYGNDLADNQNIKTLTSIEFDQRNVGTSNNMIGLNNGFTLKVQGGITKADKSLDTYFGPVFGVFEMKLLTLAMNEGGGYVFALNQHENPNHFLETTGNFVFPGAAYRVGGDANQYNYIHDDCFPMGSGWDQYYGWNGGSTAMGPGLHVAAVDTGHGDCNELQEVHYWYVNGTNYYYNVTLTAYTFNEEADFNLNNNDNLIYFYGITGNSDIKLQSVTWKSHGEGYDSDIQAYGSTDGKYNKDYRLYLSIDNKPSDMHSTTNAASQGAYVVMLPRADRTVDAGGVATTADAVAAATAPTAYVDTEAHPNVPLLGISLYDLVDNSGREYYDKHLAEDEEVRIVLTNDADGVNFQYVVNLTIKYLLGPTITGLPTIENCALPGEYIYVNSNDMTVELDEENMAITNRSWYIVSPDEDIETNAGIRSLIERLNNGENVGAECVDDQKFDNDRQIHIPAFYYRNNWRVIYEIVANNTRFYVRAMRETPEPEEGVEPEPLPPYHDRLLVHNYHRMRPWDGTSTDDHGQPKLEELHFCDGSRIYIEDNDDLARFLEWLAEIQAVSTDALPGGLTGNPQYGEDLIVFLMADVEMPANVTNAVQGLKWKGHFHGMGHNISLGNNKAFIGENAGVFYNTGFISSLASDDVRVFSLNSGKIESCFFFNSSDISKGFLIGDRSGGGVVYNSFRTSNLEDKENVNGLVWASLDEFRFGEVAYNLNHFYLKKRYNLATGTPDGDLVFPINWIYSDGEYRFANYDRQGVGIPDALRTADVPNYHDFLGIRLNATAEQVRTGAITGANATMHNPTNLVDEKRAVRDELGNILFDEHSMAQDYQPIYPLDYIFFGQDLSVHTATEAYPHANNWDNRVFRASGFYGSKVDRGFHFNSRAEAVQGTLTAIDFSGKRDAQYTTWDVDYEGVNNTADRQIWYAPALDLPDPEGENGGVESFVTVTHERDSGTEPLEHDQIVTRNLLVYQPAGWSLLDDYAETTATPANEVYCHAISDVVGGTRPAIDYMQVVDLEDFNCPIEFDVKEAVWYRRKPQLYATGNDAWEGICLPFTARMAKATIEGGDESSLRSHGEITHFYGPHEGLDVKAHSHEYWLRKFTGVDGGKAFFARPASEDDTNAGNVQEEVRTNYRYSNTFFGDVYSVWYNDSTTHTPQTPQYTTEGLVYERYPMLTRNVPYIVSFPGVRFYEFDLSGNFYANMFGEEAIPQIITFANFVDHAGGDTRTEADIIRVSDDYAANQAFAHNGYTFRGTFMRHSITASEDVIDSDADADNGSTLHRASTTDERTVMPFRCYMQMPASTPKPMLIASRGVDTIVPDLDDGDDEGGDDDELPGLEFCIDNNQLVIESPYENDFELPLFDIAGRQLRTLPIHEGANRYPGLAPGTYIVSTFKFRIL